MEAEITQPRGRIPMLIFATAGTVQAASNYLDEIVGDDFSKPTILVVLTGLGEEKIGSDILIDSVLCATRNVLCSTHIIPPCIINQTENLLCSFFF